MSVEYFTFPGNGEIVQGVLNAVATLSGSSTMAGAAQAAALFGFLVMLCVAVYKLDLKDSFVSLLVFMGVWMGFMVPKTTVLITESAGYGYTGRQYAVANVPVGLAWAGNIVTSFGLSMTRKMEQIYTIPDDLNYSRTGMLFGTRLLEGIRTARIEDATLVQDWALFMNQCSFFDLNMYRFYSVEELKNSTDILATIGKTNRAMFTNVTDEMSRTGGRLKYKTTSTVKSCNNAYSILAARSRYYLNGQGSVVSKVANKVFGELGTSVVNKNSALQSLGNTSFQYLLNNARFDTLKSIEQTAMAEIIREGSQINWQRNRNPAAAQRAFAQAQSRNQYIAAQKNGALMASWNLPLVRSVFEAVLIGLFPLVVVIALMSGIAAFRMLIFYFGGMLWIQLWAPVASIINYVLTINTKRLLSLEASYGMITPGSTDPLLMAAADAQAAAGAAMWLIPVIAGALALGGRLLLNGMITMSTGAKAGAESTGSQIGSGNINAGNMSYNNVNSNKYQPNPVYMDPQMMTATNAAGTSWTTLGGTGTSRFQANTDNYGSIASTSSVSLKDTFTEAAARSIKEGDTWSAIATESRGLASAQTTAWGLGYSINKSSENGYSLGLDASETAKFSRVNEAANQLAQKHGLSTASIVTSAIALNLSTPNGGGDYTGLKDRIMKSLPSLGWKGNTQNQDQLSTDIANTVQALQKEGISFDQSTSEKLSNTQAYKEAAGQNGTLANQSSVNESWAKQASQSAAQSYEKAKSYQEQAARVTDSSATVSINNAQYLKSSSMAANEIYDNPSKAATAAMGAAAANMVNLNEQTKGTPFKRPTDLRLDAQPENKVGQVYDRNAAEIGKISSSERGKIMQEAADVGINPSGIEQKISQARDDLSSQYSQARSGAASAIDGAETQHQNTVDQIGRKTQQLGRTVDTLPMRINSMQNEFDTQAAQQAVRDGKGYSGSGYDSVFANVVDNPDLKDNLSVQRPQSITEMPGNSQSSGSAIFRPKQ